MTVARSIVGVVLCLVLAAAVHPANGQSETQLLITSVALGESSITIKGKNFGTAAPKIVMGEAPLTVVESSATEIVTQLPPLTAGVYELNVTRSGETSPDATAKTMVIVP